MCQVLCDALEKLKYLPCLTEIEQNNFNDQSTTNSQCIVNNCGLTVFRDTKISELLWGLGSTVLADQYVTAQDRSIETQNIAHV